MKKGFWPATLAYLIPTFPLGYIWHLVTFKDAYDRLDLYRGEVIIPLGLASMVMQAIIFAWMYPKLFSTRREHWLGSALKFGATFATLAWSFTTLPVAAKYRMSSIADFLLLETGFTILQFAVVAPLIALAYREAREHGVPAAGRPAERSHAS